jgi:ATP-dependent exoDNAse (exonuclease V) alpha subunit
VIPRCKIGTGVSGAVRYVLGEGNDTATGKPRIAPKGERSRVGWIGGTGFGFPIETRDDADLARRMMEFDALNQTSRTKPCLKDCVHLSLGWRPGEEPSQAEMQRAAEEALASIGMQGARALFVSHTDEPYAHLHVVASKLDPLTGKAYDLKGNFLKLSRWAEAYEQRFSGGVINVRRQEANQMREAIERRDAAAVLALMTRRRATFQTKDLDRVFAKQIKAPAARAQFALQILSRPEILRLADAPGGPVTRYTTRAVLEAESKVSTAVAAMFASASHGAPARSLNTIIQSAGLSSEQLAAVRHATSREGLALIDGQAGTGKSFTVDAIRRIYEKAGRTVTGLAPTNVVAQDMQASGFHHAATLHSELFRLNTGRARWNANSVIILDEAAMVDTKLMAELVGHAARAGAKLIMVGDDRQLSSIDRGGMFGVLKDRYGAAQLAQVRRQAKNDDRRAAELMAEGNFDTALRMYAQKGAIHWKPTQDGAARALIETWAEDSAAAPHKSRFVFAYTNTDVDRLNAGIRAVRQNRGELGTDHLFETRHGHASFAVSDRIQFTGTDKGLGLINGAAGTIEAIEGSAISVRLDGRGLQRVKFDAGAFHEFRHGYAGTIYKGQGRTLDQTYLYHSEHWRSAASYVALTRHREKAELFVAEATAADVTTLARQMARVDERRAASHFHLVDQIPPASPAIDVAPSRVQKPKPAAPLPSSNPARAYPGRIMTAFATVARRVSRPLRLAPLTQKTKPEAPYRDEWVRPASPRSGDQADNRVPELEDEREIASFEAEAKLLHTMYGARIETVRRQLRGDARLLAVASLRRQLKAAIIQLTVRRQERSANRRAARKFEQQQRAAKLSR